MVSGKTSDDGGGADGGEGGASVGKRREEAWSSRDRGRFERLISFVGWSLFPERDHIDLATLRARNEEPTGECAKGMDRTCQLEL
jgi:hypothetical protein